LVGASGLSELHCFQIQCFTQKIIAGHSRAGPQKTKTHSHWGVVVLLLPEQTRSNIKIKAVLSRLAVFSELLCFAI
jgi:hypothetical protein